MDIRRNVVDGFQALSDHLNASGVAPNSELAQKTKAAFEAWARQDCDLMASLLLDLIIQLWPYESRPLRP